MKLSKLKESVDRAVEHAKECGQSPDDIDVSLQIDLQSIWTKEDIEVNPATDVIYSVWLKAKEDNTPVDICLLLIIGMSLSFDNCHLRFSIPKKSFWKLIICEVF